jgi:hypothetical protein
MGVFTCYIMADLCDDFMLFACLAGQNEEIVRSIRRRVGANRSRWTGKSSWVSCREKMAGLNYC